MESAPVAAECTTRRCVAAVDSAVGAARRGASIHVVAVQGAVVPADAAAGVQVVAGHDAAVAVGATLVAGVALAALAELSAGAAPAPGVASGSDGDGEKGGERESVADVHVAIILVEKATKRGLQRSAEPGRNRRRRPGARNRERRPRRPASAVLVVYRNLRALRCKNPCRHGADAASGSDHAGDFVFLHGLDLARRCRRRAHALAVVRLRRNVVCGDNARDSQTRQLRVGK